ncbi:MAG: class I SAM-dependent methyltransferase [Verrucomicrobiia bacterium]
MIQQLNLEKSIDNSDIVKMFGRISRRYDLANDFQSLFLHRLWKKRAVSLADVKTGSIALDICCGTGDISIELAKTGAFVIGVDLSIEMLNVASERAKNYFALPNCCPNAAYIPKNNLYKKKLNLHFIKADALNLPFADNLFDAITIGYGLRNLVDWRRGLVEMFRVAKPGGRIIILEFGKPENRLWRSLYFFYLKRIVPFLGKFTAGDYDAYFYIYESLVRYPGQYIVKEYLQNLGCIETKIIRILAGAMTINYCRKPLNQ